MDYIKCNSCGAPILVDDDKNAIGFCTSCGAKLHVAQNETPNSISDSVILDYYVNAVESEIYHNNALAVQNYNKILKYKPDFSPAKRGLARINISTGSKDDAAIEDPNNNVTVNFSSTKPYSLTVVFENEDNRKQKAITLMSGEKKGVKLKTDSSYNLKFRIGRREYTRAIEFRTAKTKLTVNYVFDGRNHISIVDDKGIDIESYI